MANHTPASERLLVCNCQRTMDLDGKALGTALGCGPVSVHKELCRSGIDAFRSAVESGSPVHVACTQEAPLFEEVAHALAEEAALRFTNIRETAGWSERGSQATPKMAALLAEAGHVPKMATGITLESGGVCLVYGSGGKAVEMASALAGRLAPTVVMTDENDVIPPSRAQIPLFKGRVRTASGALGRFKVTVENCASARPSSRSELVFEDAAATQEFSVDLIIDVSGGSPLFTGHDRRDGYLRVDPADPVAMARAMFEATDLVGEFEKPKYIAFDAGICAHSRSGQVGCSNCLDVCPLGAITPNGDQVAIDAAVCGGCGNCAAVCPTGAASYTVPYRSDAIARLSILLRTYLEAGGQRPIVLAHDESHGSELISAMARFGRGLPDNVIPMSFNSVLMLGHDAITAAMSLGAERVIILAPPKHPEELASLDAQAELANTILAGLGFGGERVAVMAELDPDAVEEALYAAERLPQIKPGALTAMGSKREVARSVFGLLHDRAPNQIEVLELPEGAPYGMIEVDTDGCTLCLACVSACPANALRDNPDRPQLSFVEAACVQCGVCVATCPEKVIGLKPRYNFASEALAPHVMKMEEPFHCVSCGKEFGSKSSIERIVDKLRGHSMFKGEDQLKLIQMCDNCRVVALANSGIDPFSGGARPKVRTTDDYLVEREEDKKTS